MRDAPLSLVYRPAQPGLLCSSTAVRQMAIVFALLIHTHRRIRIRVRAFLSRHCKWSAMVKRLSISISISISTSIHGLSIASSLSKHRPPIQVKAALTGYATRTPPSGMHRHRRRHSISRISSSKGCRAAGSTTSTTSRHCIHKPCTRHTASGCGRSRLSVFGSSSLAHRFESSTALSLSLSLSSALASALPSSASASASESGRDKPATVTYSKCSARRPLWLGGDEAMTRADNTHTHTLTHMHTGLDARLAHSQAQAQTHTQRQTQTHTQRDRDTEASPALRCAGSLRLTANSPEKMARIIIRQCKQKK